jgi:hypothetical protein
MIALADKAYEIVAADRLQQARLGRRIGGDHCHVFFSLGSMFAGSDSEA